MKHGATKARPKSPKSPKNTKKKGTPKKKGVPVYRITEQPEGFKPSKDHHIDWTARFQGEVKNCKQALRKKTVELPPQGAYIRSLKEGRYFLISYRRAPNQSISELTEDLGQTAGYASGRTEHQDLENGLDGFAVHDESKQSHDQSVLLATLEHCGLNHPVDVRICWQSLFPTCRHI